MSIKKIVCFGGGSAMPEVVLKPLKRYPARVTSITSMTDDGGSTGGIRREFGVLPPGDIRRHILAFSDAPQWKKDLWSLRFGSEEFEGGHKGHNFANVFIAGMEKNMKKYGEVLAECRRFMEIPAKYNPLPATVSKVVLCAELEDGVIIEGEHEIDIPKKHNAGLKIKKIFLRPAGKAYKESLTAISEADALIFGPGDLYSSLLACFLPSGIKAAISKSKAKKIFVCNVMNKKGETDNFSVGDFVLEVEKYTGVRLDYVLYNKNMPNKDIMKKACKEDSSLFGAVLPGDRLDERFKGANLLKKNTVLHDPKKTIKIIWRLVV